MRPLAIIFSICIAALCSGCISHAYFDTAQPVDLTIRSLNGIAVPNAEVAIAKFPPGSTAKQPTATARTFETPERKGVDSMVTSDSNGRVHFMLDTSIYVGIFDTRQPLQDRVTGSDRWVRVRTTAGTDVLHVHMVPHATTKGEHFAVEVNEIGPPRRLSEPLD